MRLEWIDGNANRFPSANIKAKSPEFSHTAHEPHGDTWQPPVAMYPTDRRDNVAQIVVDDPRRDLERPSNWNSRRSFTVGHSAPAAQSMPRSTIVRASLTSKS